MQGVKEFVDFCHDEFWDLKVDDYGVDAFLHVDILDPRYGPILDYLKDVMFWTGIVRLEPWSSGILVIFDRCGADYPSMVFRVRSTFQVPTHRSAAMRRDRDDQLEVLSLYSNQGQKFMAGFIHPAIRRIQYSLNAHGLPCPTDGRWGIKTRWTLWRFRRRHHLPTPKFIDHRTIEALEV